MTCPHCHGTGKLAWVRMDGRTVTVTCPANTHRKDRT